MRTNIDIDDGLLAKAMEGNVKTTKKAIVEEALALLVRTRAQRRALENMRGIGWEGDLDQMRDDWSPDKDWGLHEK